MTIHPAIQRKIQLLQEYFSRVREYAQIDTPIIVANPEKQAAMERYFLLMVDEAVDINGALAYQIGNKIPETNRSTFIELAALGVVDEQLALQLGESVKIRNQLAHGYEKLQKTDAVDAMKKFVEMYHIYLKTLIQKYIPHS